MTQLHRLATGATVPRNQRVPIRDALAIDWSMPAEGLVPPPAGSSGGAGRPRTWVSGYPERMKARVGVEDAEPCARGPALDGDRSFPAVAQPRGELMAAGDPKLGVDALQVVVHRAFREERAPRSRGW